MFCSSKLWLDIKPIPVNFIIYGNGKCNATVQLNKKNDNKFKKVRSESKRIDLEKTEIAKFNIKRAKHAKKFRIVVDICENSNLIKIKNIQFRDGKYIFYDMNKYTVKGAKSEVKNDELIIYPKSEVIYITYNDKVRIRASIRFNFEIFIIILVLSFLLIYKASDYLADFSVVKHKSRIDIIFLLIFFSFLFVPMSYINQEEISQQENRRLATWKPFIKKNGEINFNFGKDYEKWFNDRFNLRCVLISNHSYIKISLNKMYVTPKAIYDKKYKLLYTSNFYGIKQKIPNENLSKMVNNINDLNDYCNKHNIKLYLLFVPRKSIFCEHSKYSNKWDKYDYAEDLIREIVKENKVKIIYPKNEMLKANKRTPMYFKTDHHWTKTGALIGYSMLLDEIITDFPKVKKIKESELNKYYNNKVSEHWDKKFNNGQTTYLIKFPPKLTPQLLGTQYIYYDNPYKKDLKNRTLKEAGYTNCIDGKEDDYFYYPYAENIKVLIIGNSFARNLVEFLPYSFRQVVRFKDNYGGNRSLNMNYYTPFILEYKPDIIVLNFHTAALEVLMNLNINKNINIKE